jgi:hypothetical protein
MPITYLQFVDTIRMAWSCFTIIVHILEISTAHRIYVPGYGALAAVVLA